MRESGGDGVVDAGSDGLSGRVVGVCASRCAGEDTSLSDMLTSGLAHVVCEGGIHLLGAAGDDGADARPDAGVVVDGVDLALDGDDGAVCLDLAHVVDEGGGKGPEGDVALRLPARRTDVREAVIVVYVHGVQSEIKVITLHGHVVVETGVVVEVHDVRLNEELAALVEVAEDAAVRDIIVRDERVAANDAITVYVVDELLLAVIIEHGDVGDIVDTLARDEVRGIVEFVAVELDELIHWHLFPRWGRRTPSGEAGVTGCVSRKVRVDRRRTY